MNPGRAMNQRPRGYFSWTALALAVLCLGLFPGCAKRVPGPESAPARQVWEAFDASRRDAARGLAALRATASLQYKGPERNSRTLLKFWGNLGHPYRLDVQAGIGAVIAHLREDERRSMAFFPRQNTASEAFGPRESTRLPGLEVPLSLADVAALAAGTFTGLIPRDFADAEPGPEDGWRYIFVANSRVESVALDPTGRPVQLTGRSDNGNWRLSLDKYQDQEPGGPPATARKLTLDLPGKTMVVLRIKEFQRLDRPWAEAALALELPPGVRIVQ